MNALKELLEKKRQAAQGQQLGERKYAKQADLEEQRLKRVREEELREREEKERKKRLKSGPGAAVLQRHESAASQEEDLPREEVIRRLRLLGQPITLFGEDDAARMMRLRKAQEDYQLEDEAAGTGQQANSLLLLQRDNKLKAGQHTLGGTDPSVNLAAAGSKAAVKPAGGGDTREDGTAEATEEEPEEGETARAFREAAEALREQREEAAMAVEDRISKHLQRYCKLWEEDLDRRPEEVKRSGPGNQATLQYQQTVTYFKPLWKQLRHRAVHPEMVAGLHMIIQDIHNRNYLHAYSLYMSLAIGNNPWPIGVTSVGIHERSAREKISHVMNGGAHIMNDEATRKYLQAVKRLLTFCQRAFPTDPSRSVDFDSFRDAGRGAAGSGSDKRALLEAERTGQTWKQLGLLPAPHFHDKDGSVKVPAKWDNILKQSQVYKEIALESSAAKTPPKTPPRPASKT